MAKRPSSASGRSAPVTSARPAADSSRRLVVLLFMLLALSLAGNVFFAWRGRSAGTRPPDADAVTPAAAAPVAPVHPVPEKLLPYAALGTYVAATNRIPDLDWSEAQFAAFAEGLRACYAGRPYPFDEHADRLRNEINARVQAMTPEGTGDPIEQYFGLLREREAVQRTASNLHFRITTPGDGPVPHADDTVVVSYAARLPGGEALPNLSRARVKVKVNDLLPGLSEGLQLLPASAKALLYLPPELSFGEGRWPSEVPRGAPVVFFVELHEVVREDW